MTTALAIGAFVLGLALLVFGSDWLVKGAARLAARLGMSPFAIGVTVVAFGTSTPELFASIRAALTGVGDLAVGNVLGSNIANVCLILGATAAIHAVRVERAVMRLELPVMIGITLIAGMTLMDGVVTRVEGGALALGLVAYVVFAYRVGKDDPELSVEIGHEGEAEASSDPDAPAWRDFALIVSGLAALAVGAWLLVWGASYIATELLGVSTAVVGLTVVAFGTSLPELAASLRAVLAREQDIAVGNIVGSNVFNLLSVMGITAVIAPLDAPEMWHVWVVLGTSLLCYPVLALFKRGSRDIGRTQGVLMVLGYLVYVVLAYRLSG
ncbi:MAG: calcium/sodium antiporter [Phycisphaerales bacterium]